MRGGLDAIADPIHRLSFSCALLSSQRCLLLLGFHGLCSAQVEGAFRAMCRARLSGTYLDPIQSLLYESVYTLRVLVQQRSGTKHPSFLAADVLAMMFSSDSRVRDGSISVATCDAPRGLGCRCRCRMPTLSTECSSVQLAATH